MSIGLDLSPLEHPSPLSTSAPTDILELLAENERQLAELAVQVQEILDEHDLDSYGAFRVAIDVIDALPIKVGAGLHGVAQALHAGEWSMGARVLAVGALLRNLGYFAGPYAQDDGKLFIGLSNSDTSEQINAARKKLRVRRAPKKGHAKVDHDFRFLLWDGVERLGAKTKAERQFPTGMLFEGPTRPFTFVGRKNPDFLLNAAEPSALRLYGDHGELPFMQRPLALSYIQYYPALSFQEHVIEVTREVASLDMGPALRDLRIRVGDDHAYVTLLLRTLQTEFEYIPGAIRSAYQILHDRQGDCDQLSGVMAGLLTESGWSLEDLAVLRWRHPSPHFPGHIALGLRPQGSTPPPTAHAFNEGKRGTYVALDTVYFRRHKTKGVISEWGDISDKYRNRRPQVSPLR